MQFGVQTPGGGGGGGGGTLTLTLGLDIRIKITTKTHIIKLTCVVTKNLLSWGFEYKWLARKFLTLGRGTFSTNLIFDGF